MRVFLHSFSQRVIKSILLYKNDALKVEVKVLVAQSCPVLFDPMHCSPPHSSVHGILQARILEWVAIPFSRVSSQPRHSTCFSFIVCGFFIAEPPGKLSKYHYSFLNYFLWTKNYILAYIYNSNTHLDYILIIQIVCKLFAKKNLSK